MHILEPCALRAVQANLTRSDEHGHHPARVAIWERTSWWMLQEALNKAPRSRTMCPRGGPRAA
eukprot:4011921-Pyramimonas_sp.AAC.1